MKTYCSTLVLSALCLGATTTAALGQVGEKDPGQREEKHRGDEIVPGSRAPFSNDTFAWHAVQSGMNEIELSRLALSKSSDAKIRDYAQMMVDDHSKANRELRDIARRQNLQVPAELASSTNAPVSDAALAVGVERQRERALEAKKGKGIPDPAKPYPQGVVSTLDTNHLGSRAVVAKNRTLEELQAASGAEFDQIYARAMRQDHVLAVAHFEEASRTLPESELKRFAVATLPKLRAHLERANDLGPGATNR